MDGKFVTYSLAFYAPSLKDSRYCWWTYDGPHVAKLAIPGLRGQCDSTSLPTRPAKRAMLNSILLLLQVMMEVGATNLPAVHFVRIHESIWTFYTYLQHTFHLFTSNWSLLRGQFFVWKLGKWLLFKIYNRRNHYRYTSRHKSIEGRLYSFPINLALV